MASDDDEPESSDKKMSLSLVMEMLSKRKLSLVMKMSLSLVMKMSLSLVMEM